MRLVRSVRLSCEHTFDAGTKARASNAVRGRQDRAAPRSESDPAGSSTGVPTSRVNRVRPLFERRWRPALGLQAMLGGGRNPTPSEGEANPGCGGRRTMCSVRLCRDDPQPSLPSRRSREQELSDVDGEREITRGLSGRGHQVRPRLRQLPRRDRDEPDPFASAAGEVGRGVGFGRAGGRAAGRPSFRSASAAAAGRM